jgi:hypothetical protein
VASASGLSGAGSGVVALNATSSVLNRIAPRPQARRARRRRTRTYSTSWSSANPSPWRRPLRAGSNARPTAPGLRHGIQGRESHPSEHDMCEATPPITPRARRQRHWTIAASPERLSERISEGIIRDTKCAGIYTKLREATGFPQGLRIPRRVPVPEHIVECSRTFYLNGSLSTDPRIHRQQTPPIDPSHAQPEHPIVVLRPV